MEGDKGVDGPLVGRIVAADEHGAERTLPHMEHEGGWVVGGQPLLQLEAEGAEPLQPRVADDGGGTVGAGQRPAKGAHLHRVEAGQWRCEQPGHSVVVTRGPAHHVDGRDDDGLVVEGGVGRGHWDGVAGEGPGDGSGSPARVADQHGHVGPANAGVACSQQLAGYRLGFDRGVAAPDEHR